MAKAKTKPPIRLNELHAHEALHTTHLLIAMLAEHVSGHPFVEQTPRLVRMAQQAEDALAMLYDAINEEGAALARKAGEPC